MHCLARKNITPQNMFDYLELLWLDYKHIET